ncbi:MAG: YchJ family protein [Nitrospirae bacterium]|nr:YchJ family protein [Nitrospirota bacterium]
MELCPCGSNIAYSECCRPLIKADRPALTAEQLMRSRYSAYVKKEMEYIFTSLHPNHRSDYDEKSTRDWAENAEWHTFEIIDTKKGGPEDIDGHVEFVVTFTEQGIKKEHRELSSFRKQNGTWFFTTGKIIGPKPVVRTTPKTGRNDPCECGSGKKFKKCCGQ